MFDWRLQPIRSRIDSRGTDVGVVSDVYLVGVILDILWLFSRGRPPACSSWRRWRVSSSSTPHGSLGAKGSSPLRHCVISPVYIPSFQMAIRRCSLRVEQETQENLRRNNSYDHYYFPIFLWSRVFFCAASSKTPQSSYHYFKYRPWFRPIPPRLCGPLQGGNHLPGYWICFSPVFHKNTHHRQSIRIFCLSITRVWHPNLTLTTHLQSWYFPLT